MAESNRFTKPVAFNHTKETDQAILKHVKRRNFSGYVKKLILEDIERKKSEKKSTEPQPIKSQDGVIKIDLT